METVKCVRENVGKESVWTVLVNGTTSTSCYWLVQCSNWITSDIPTRFFVRYKFFTSFYSSRVLMPYPTKSRSFRGQSLQPITWLILTNKTVRDNTQTKYNSKKQNNAKYSKIKLPRFSHLWTTLGQEKRWAYSTHSDLLDMAKFIILVDM